MEKTEYQILKDYKSSKHFTHCIICDNELTKKQYSNWRKCCCRNCSNKLKRIYYRTPEMRDKLSEATSKAMKREDVKINMSKANKEVWQREGYKEKMSNIQSNSMKNKWSSEEYRQLMQNSMHTETYKENASRAQQNRFSKNDERLKISNAIQKKWLDTNYRKKQELANIKRYNTKKLRGSFNKSLQAENSKNRLKQCGFAIEEEKLYPDSKTLHCDVYVIDLDLWIEFHYSHYHGAEPYDCNNPEHIKQLKELQYRLSTSPKNSRGINQYYNIIKNWTDYDVRRKQIAKAHNLNYLCFYTEKDFNKWLENIYFLLKGNTNEKTRQ